MVFLLTWIAGCRLNMVSIRETDMPTITVRTPGGASGVTDQREEFARYFCNRFSVQSDAADAVKSCRSWLRLPPLVNVKLQEPIPASRPRTVVFIPGIFGECVAKTTTPFSDAYHQLRAEGHRVFVLPVDGRSSSETNGKTIDAWMRSHAPELDSAIVVGYSKGTTDFMHAALRDAKQRQWFSRIAVLVTIAGVVNGTPLASHGETAYARLFSGIDIPACRPGDKGGVSSLTYREAMKSLSDFLTVSPLPRMLSVTAVASRSSINPVLRPFYGQLRQLDERNDGQVLVEDAIFPGSEFVAEVSADHWSVALPFETSGPTVKALSIKNHFPRIPLIFGILDYVNTRTSGHSK